MKYGNLPGEENRLYVFFHSYTTSGDMVIGRFYCDAAPSKAPTFSLAASVPALGVVQNTGTTLEVTVNPQAGFTGEVNFSLSGLPAGVDAALLPSSSTTGTTGVLFVTPSAAIGSYPVVVTGMSGTVTQTSTFTLTVKAPPPKPQTITFKPIEAQHVGGKLTVSASATSGLAVSFSVVPNGNCSIAGRVVTFLHAGNCGVIASQAGNGTYLAAPSVGQVIVIGAT
jgi:hypothetical protein